MKSNDWRSLLSDCLEKSEDDWIAPILERRESVRERYHALHVRSAYLVQRVRT